MSIWWRLLTSLTGVTSTITACGCLCSPWDDAEGSHSCVLCCLWAPSAAQCSASSQTHQTQCGFQALETAHARKKALSPILLDEVGAWGLRSPGRWGEHSAWGLGPCPRQCLQWIKHPHGTCTTPQTDFWPQRVLRYSCCLMLSGPNIL